VVKTAKTSLASEGHSRTIKHGARRSSGQRNNTSKRGALTSCRAKSEGVVRTTKYQRVRGTHGLSSAERGYHQDSEIKPASERHSLSVECGTREPSGQRNKANKRGVLTSYRVYSGGVVRTAKYSQRVRVTNSLSSVERGCRQDSEIKPASQGHSLSVGCRARVSSDRKRKIASQGHLRPVERRGNVNSGQRNTANETRGTHGRWDLEEVVRTAK
jgi:hypothetical protein